MKKNKRTNGRTLLDWIYLALLGSLGFSMLGHHIIMNVFHFPIFFIEWLYLPIIKKYAKKAATKLRRISQCHAGLLILMMFGIVYGIVDSGSASFLTDYRSVVYLFILYRFVKDEGFQHHYLNFLYICLFATISEFLFVAVFSTRNIVSSTNCLAVSIAIIGFFICGYYKTGLLAFGVSMLTGILSGYRIGIVFSAISLIIACCYSIFHGSEHESLSKKAQKIIYVAVVFGVMFYFIENYENIVMTLANRFHLDQFAIFRVTTRMRSILRLDFSQSQDSGRLAIWMTPFIDFFSSVMPRGFLRTPGLYIDVPILILYDAFGSIASWLIIAFIVKKSIGAIRKIIKHKKEMDIDQIRCAELSIYMLPILIGLMVTNGTFIKNIYQSIQTGTIIGLIVHTSKITRSRLS